MGKNSFIIESKLTKKIKDKDIRAALTSLLEQKFCSQVEFVDCSRIYNEFSVDHGEHRIDVAVVNSDIHGYEIKSDADTLYRLPAQVESYNNVFNKVTLVAGVSHIFDALFMIPDWWGVMLAKNSPNGTVVLSNLRDPLENPSQDMMSLARLMWKREVLETLNELNELRGVKSKTREHIYKRFVSVADKETIQKTVIEKLFNREVSQADQPQLQYDG